MAAIWDRPALEDAGGGGGARPLLFAAVSLRTKFSWDPYSAFSQGGEPGLKHRSSHVTFGVMFVCFLHHRAIQTGVVMFRFGALSGRDSLGVRRLL